jgi:hypothetical protein
VLIGAAALGFVLLHHETPAETPEQTTQTQIP